MIAPRTVLLIDDDANFRRVLEYQLQDDGYRVLAVPSAAAALQRLQNDHEVNVVLTDVKMPVIDGIELVARSKVLRRDLPVVVLTAHGTIQSAVEAMKCGAFDYLT